MIKDNLHTLPNIGKILTKRLKEIEINTVEELMSVGSENAFIRLYTVDNSTCINELLALEGAIQGIRWHSLSEYRKNELKIFYRMCKLQQNNNAKTHK